MAMDNNYVPKNYQDLYLTYIVGDGHGGSLCSTLIRRFIKHATPDETESLTHDVFLRCMEKDVIKSFDPTKANFGGVIFFVTRSICINHLDRKGRNPITGLNGGSLVETDPEDGQFEPGVYSLERIGGTTVPRIEEQIDAKRVLNSLLDELTALAAKPRHKRDQSLLPLFRLMTDQVDPQEAAAQLGVTASTIHNWQQEIRRMAALHRH